MTEYSKLAIEWVNNANNPLDLPLSLESLMRAQHAFTLSLLEQKPGSVLLKKVASSLSQHRHATFFLETIGISTESYLIEHGMNRAEIELMSQGTITLRELLMQKPGIVIPSALLTTESRLN